MDAETAGVLKAADVGARLNVLRRLNNEAAAAAADLGVGSYQLTFTSTGSIASATTNDLGLLAEALLLLLRSGRPLSKYSTSEMEANKAAFDKAVADLPAGLAAGAKEERMKQLAETRSKGEKRVARTLSQLLVLVGIVECIFGRARAPSMVSVEKAAMARGVEGEGREVLLPAWLKADIGGLDGVTLADLWKKSGWGASGGIDGLSLNSAELVALVKHVCAEYAAKRLKSAWWWWRRCSHQFPLSHLPYSFSHLPPPPPLRSVQKVAGG